MIILLPETGRLAGKSVIADVIKSVNERMPQAVVAVNDDGGFEGYFSPEDYRQAQSILSANPSLGTLE